jgi:rare lipoprotein A
MHQFLLIHFRTHYKGGKRIFSAFILFLFFQCFATGCSTTAKHDQTTTTTIATQRPYVIKNRTHSPLPSAVGFEETGLASWYGSYFHGKTTANGETYNMYGISAAHKLLPMHTMLLVTNLDNGKEVVVRVNDRGPFVRGRIIDLSYGAAKKISLVQAGIARVKITALDETKFDKKTENRRVSKHTDLKSGEYFVQIGTFTDEYKSLSLQKKFRNFGHKVVIKQSSSKGEILYRVQIYAGKTLSNARRSERTLREKGYKCAFIIPR